MAARPTSVLSALLPSEAGCSRLADWMHWHNAGASRSQVADPSDMVEMPV